MITLCNNFYNEFSNDYRKIYFANENHGDSKNENYWNAKEITELFNNGCVNYNRFIAKLAKYCNTTEISIELLVSKYIKL